MFSVSTVFGGFLVIGLIHAQSPPHIVMLLGDDMGFNDIGYADLTMKTPTINALAADGVKLNNMYTWNWCAPSRASLMTGRYVPNIGYEKAPDGPSNDGDGTGDAYVVPLEFPMMPAALKEQAGYKTLMAGHTGSRTLFSSNSVIHLLLGRQVAPWVRYHGLCS